MDIKNLRDTDLEILKLKILKEQKFRKSQLELKEIFAKNLSELKNRMIEMSEIWLDFDDTSFVDVEYPFNSSFDELTSDVCAWNDSVQEHVYGLES